ncbi:SpoIIE family protein phosphatase [Streptomyces sp. NBC_00841]|uniref:SpoIIE family protein phosphatase n=1 Tax=Streptomyces sp. NBC_00841 TaxID=2975847 RepID=UPI003FA39FDD
MVCLGCSVLGQARSEPAAKGRAFAAEWPKRRRPDVPAAGGARGTACPRRPCHARATGPRRDQAQGQQSFTRCCSGFCQLSGACGGPAVPDPHAVLQPRVEAAAQGSGVDFVGVMNRDGIYAAHSVLALIGKHTATDTAPLLAGKTVQEEVVGTLGPQIRAYVPAKAPDGSVVGAVNAGITVQHVSETAAEQLPVLLGATFGAMAITTAGAALLIRRLSRQTHGLDPAQITRMYEHHDAVLHSVKEGVLIVDKDGRLLLANDEAQRLLDLHPAAEGRHADELNLPPRIAELLTSGREATDEVHTAADRLLVVNQRPTDRYGGPPGSVATVRDATELRMAVTLQRSLLPHGLPEQNALEVAHRYLPAEAGVGGDWFDVIPLSGGRVALVVGDVVGHGVHAAATMGRLRTAVHNFSTLDLPPHDLLWHLDELVDRIDQQEAGNDDALITGATCLYAIYDPVTGRCSLARAGHPPPAVVHPDGNVTFLDVPACPPLGIGSGLPFETTDLHLPEGSRLVLYTDGLIEYHLRDIDTGLALLRTALTGQPHLSPEETCRHILDVMLPQCPSDDIALLVARTCLLDPAQVAEWDVPSDPAAVAPIRTQCAQRLEGWGLEEIAFSTELILSELITNAIRYGTQPIKVRMVCDLSLICEVADGSSTSPHLRRAATSDEGGRGLFLIAQYAQHWGTRYTSRGKVIWTEQSLHGGATEPSADLVDALLDQWDE